MYIDDQHIKQRQNVGPGQISKRFNSDATIELCFTQCYDNKL